MTIAQSSATIAGRHAVWIVIAIVAAMSSDMKFGFGIVALREEVDDPELAKQSQVLSDAEFKSIKRVSEAIYDLAPPQNAIIIGVGRSPAPFAAYLQAKYGDDYVYNVPLSSFNYDVRDDRTEEITLLKHFDKEKWKKKLFENFGLYLPRVVGMKQIVIVDYVAHCRSVAATKHYIQEFFAANTVKFIAIRTDSKMAKMFENTKVHICCARFKHLIDKEIVLQGDRGQEDDAIGTKLAGQKYDALAPFGSFKVETDDVPETASGPSVAYTSLKEEIQRALREEVAK